MPSLPSTLFRSVLAALMGCTAAAAQTSEAERANFPVAASAHRQFLVSGIESPDHAQLAAWAEQVVNRVEEALGCGIPFSPTSPIQMVGSLNQELGKGRVVKAQGWVDDGLAQKLVLVNPSALEEYDILEGLCWLLLNRCAVIYQDPESRERKPVEVPDWLSAGIAQFLYPESRARSAEIALSRLDGDTLPSLQEVLRWEYLPEGRWTDKNVAGAVLSWMRSLPDFPVLLQRLLQRAAFDQPITPEWLAAQLAPASPGPVALEGSWRNWVSNRAMVRRDWGSTSERDFEDLRRALAVERERDGARVTIHLDELVTMRDRSWARSELSRLRIELQRLAIGRDPSFQKLIEEYHRLVEAALGDRGAGRPEVEKRLRDMVSAADQHAAMLFQLTRERNRYLQELESRLTAGPILDRPAGEVEPAAAEAYLDEVSARLGR